MDARFGKILLSILCGALLLIAGCTTAPSPGVTPTPVPTTQVQVSNPDLGYIISLLQTTNEELSVIADNTRPAAGGSVTGNLVLFDVSDSPANAITTGTSVVALPPGKCDVLVYTGGVRMFTTVEEMKDYASREINSRNKQTCLDVNVCRVTVTLDNDFSYLYITYKPYQDSDRLTRVTIGYRC
ncbi:MAG: hypothetical protein LUQ67_01625 [Methanomicrobiales archaeon]|nr:hypothetical protein [Methanomicrobiales archaeon]